MHKPGHFGLGLLVASPFVAVGWVIGGPLWMVIYLFTSLLGALSPDIDQKPIVPCKHHGFTHTVIFGLISALFISALVFLFQDPLYQELIRPFTGADALPLSSQLGLSALAGVAMFAGVASHLFGDALSKATGTLLIRPFYPISSEYIKYGVTTAGNPYYNYGLLTAGVFAQAAVIAALFVLPMPV